MSNDLVVAHPTSTMLSASSQPTCVGELRLVNNSDNQILATRRIYIGHDLIIGRDRNKCQWVLCDPYLSAKHLRIYTIIYENDENSQLEQLVYAEDLSRHGTFWNDSLIGKGKGGFLLSHGDRLRLSAKTHFTFHSPTPEPSMAYFDLEQETEMIRFRHEYVVTDRLLGAGTFGRVFMAIQQQSRVQVACKVVDLRELPHTVSSHFRFLKRPVRANRMDQAAQTQQIELWAQKQRKKSPLEVRLESCFREVDILSKLSHPNIIGLEKVYVTDYTIYIFQDLITAGDLFSYLESKNGKLLEVEAAVIIRQILIALQFLHRHNIVHRDLKPENVMMTSLSTGCRVVLTDFGAARQLSQSRRMNSIVGTDEYAAPEVNMIRRQREQPQIGYTKAVDMWSVGAITAVLLTGGSAFSDPSTGSYSPILARTCNLDYLQRSVEWKEASARPKDFVYKLLVLDERKRLTTDEGLQHPWFSNEFHKTDFEDLYQRTIKNWYPRVAQDSAVEFMKSSFVRHLAPSKAMTAKAVTVLKKGAYQEVKPIDPPYKPFPRNMHLQLWPPRRYLGRSMSGEVKRAISDNWHGPPKRALSMFHPPEESTRISSCMLSTALTVKRTHVDQTSISTILKPKTSESISLPLRPVATTLPTSRPAASYHQRLAKDDVNFIKPRLLVDHDSNKENSHHSLGSIHRLIPIGSTPRAKHRTFSLRRRSPSSNEPVPAKKRWRNSMFDLQYHIEGVSDTDDGSSNYTTSKRVKVSEAMG